MQWLWVDCNLGLQIAMVVEQIQLHQTTEHVHDYHHYEHSPPSIGLLLWCFLMSWLGVLLSLYAQLILLDFDVVH
jgi:hypothetical protein